jgi:hypothetical protein
MAASELMVSSRNFQLVTTHPLSFNVRAGQPIRIPRAMIQDAIAAGMTFVAEDKTEEVLAPKHINPEPSNAAEREQLLNSILEEIADRNDPKDFTAAGVPAYKTVSTIARFSVSQREINGLWDVRKRIAEEKANQARLDKVLGVKFMPAADSAAVDKDE